jgi:hypothetical protein
MSSSADGTAPSDAPPPRRGRSVRPGDLVALGLVLLVAVVAFVVAQGGVGGPAPPVVALTPGASRRLMAERPRVATPATFDLRGDPGDGTATFTEGAALVISFRLAAAGRPLILEQRADRTIALLYPPVGQPSVVVPAGERVDVVDARGGTYTVQEPAGPRRLRLIVFPPDVDPFAIQPVELSRLVSRLTIVERQYVAAAREESGG